MKPRTAALLSVALLGGCASFGPLPRQAVEQNEIGVRALARGDLESAEASFRVALEYHARFSEPHSNLGLVALRRGRIDEARAQFAAAIRLNPNFAEARNDLGVTEMRAGRLEEAEASLRAALRVDPGYRAARMNLARVLVARSRLEEAREQLVRMSVLAANDASVLGLLAFVDHLRSDDASALAEAGRALAVNSASPEAALARGSVWLGRHAFDRAVADLRVAADYAPAPGAEDATTGGSSLLGEARARLALAYAGAGDGEAARRTAREVLRVDAEEPRALFVLGMIAAAEGAHADAVGFLERSVRRNPGFALAREALASSERALHPRP